MAFYLCFDLVVAGQGQIPHEFIMDHFFIVLENFNINLWSNSNRKPIKLITELESSGVDVPGLMSTVEKAVAVAQKDLGLATDDFSSAVVKQSAQQLQNGDFFTGTLGKHFEALPIVKCYANAKTPKAQTSLSALNDKTGSREQSPCNLTRQASQETSITELTKAAVKAQSFFRARVVKKELQQRKIEKSKELGGFRA